MSFTLSRVPIETRRRRLAVRRVEDLTPRYRRIVLEGAELAGFDSPGADDHVRIFFPPAGTALPDSLDGVELASREFTPAVVEGATLAFDFVLHGVGPASEWAAAAAVGDEVLVGGPRGAMVIDGEPDWWLLAGDLTAVPAIRRFLGTAPSGVPVDVIVLGDGVEGLGLPTDVVGRRLRVVGSLDELLAAIEATELPEGEGFAFVAAEQAVVAPARELLTRQGVDLGRAVVKGYWRHGLTADAPK